MVTQESQEKVLPCVLEKIDRDYDVFQIDDPDDANRIYNKLAPKFREMQSAFDHLVVDFTSGTKAMTGALAILGSLY